MNRKKIYIGPGALIKATACADECSVSGLKRLDLERDEVGADKIQMLGGEVTDIFKCAPCNTGDGDNSHGLREWHHRRAAS